MSKDGNSYIIGTNVHTTNEYNYYGSFEVFTNTNGTWDKKGETLSGVLGEGLGTGLAINQDGTIIAAVGADYENMKGITKIYMWENNAWIEKQNFIGKHNWENSPYNSHTALNDDVTILAVTGPNYTLDLNGTTYPQNSYVKIYELTGGVYVQKGNTIYGNYFDNHPLGQQLGSRGLEFNSDGSVIIIGCIGHRTALVYEWNGNDWVKKGRTLTQVIDHQPLPNDDGEDLYGSSVSINDSGNIIAVGCKYGDKIDIHSTGYVEIYEWNENENDWIQKGSRLYGYNTYYDTGGNSISLNNNGLIICYASNWYNYKGMVQVARFDTVINDWVLINGPNGDSIITRDDLIFNARYGTNVSLNGMGTRFIVNAPNQNDGLIEIYDLIT